MKIREAILSVFIVLAGVTAGGLGLMTCGSQGRAYAEVARMDGGGGGDVTADQFKNETSIRAAADAALTTSVAAKLPLAGGTMTGTINSSAATPANFALPTGNMYWNTLLGQSNKNIWWNMGDGGVTKCWFKFDGATDAQMLEPNVSASTPHAALYFEGTEDPPLILKFGNYTGYKNKFMVYKNGNIVFNNSSSAGNAIVGGNATVWGSSDTYGPVTAHGGITGLVSAAKRTLYVDFDAGNDSNGGTSWVDAYATSAKIATETPAILKPFHNYSLFATGTNNELFALSDVVTPNSCIYMVGATTVLDSGTVTSYHNNATYPDGLSRVSDGAASFGNYSGDMLTVNGVDYTIAYTNATSAYTYDKFESTPSGAFTISSYDWHQNGGISFTNLGSFHLSRCHISNAPGNAITLNSASGMMSAIYVHDCTTGQGRAMSLTACPSVTASRVVSRANKNGFIVFGSSLTASYCSVKDTTNTGFNFSGGSSGLISNSESVNNATGYQYTNTATTSGLYSNNRAAYCATGIQVDGNAVCKAISGTLIDGCDIGINAATGGQVTVTGATTINGGIPSPTTGVAVQEHGGLKGYASITFANLTTNLAEDSTSFGYADN